MNLLMKNKMPEQRNMSRSRRGIAIEMAMLFLVVVVALSIVLVSVSMMQIGKMDSAYEEMEQRMMLEQIGEDFCSQQGKSGYTPPQIKGYEIFNEGTTLRVYTKPVGVDSKPVLTVELTQNGDGTYTVTKWSYGE